MPRISSWAWYAALLVMGAVVATISRAFPAHLPFFLPWQFHWVEFLGTFLTLAWFWRGLHILPAGAQPSLWRKVCFVAGVLSLYIVLQTQVDYYAQHMFFVH
ncbi:MAG: cytochrome c oxidase assembly protein, partial [Rhizomicrobium sp.]